MNKIQLDEKWVFRRGLLDSLGVIEQDPGEVVNLPHDGMIGTEVSKDAKAVSDSGYFNGDVCSYTKNIFIPKELEKGCVGLKFDGVMMHSSIDINGYKVGEHHYGYSPFYVDITDYVTYGEENRITVNINTGVQPSSRWYTGSGLFRGVTLCTGPKIHICDDGVFVYTKEVSDNIAFLNAHVEVCNKTLDNRLVNVKVELKKDGSDTTVASGNTVIQVNARDKEVAMLPVNVHNPELWDADNPNLYNVCVKVTDKGIYRTHFTPGEECTVDKSVCLFGIRTITTDAIRGLRINGNTVKLKGGCVHHDNGLLGAVSLYASEERRVKKLKEIGFNAIRTAHNPPSQALVEACDRVGMYIFDEAFDAWGVAKRTGDYSGYFSTQWKNDLTSFVRRDRIHPSVIMWSTGNEIPERGGMNNGYGLATQLANTIKELDSTRPVSHGICTLWAGLDDYLAKDQNHNQNASEEIKDRWEKITEPFTNGLDVVGYNYMEDQYERDHELFPDRVILGSENFPQQIGFRWPLVERLPYVIGEFTWTCWDYIGEAGIGKAVYVTEDDPLNEKGSWSLMPPSGSPFPWRTANDADVDINGNTLAQGMYRSIVWGSDNTYVLTLHPEHYGKIEMMTMWGFPAYEKNWNYADYDGKPIDVYVFSNGDEVELFVNGKSIERKPVSLENPMPHSTHFVTTYEEGIVEAVSYRDGKEISRDQLQSSKKPAKLVLKPETTVMKADGHDLVYVAIEVRDEDDILVTDAEVSLEAFVEGEGYLAGFGSANPITEDNYTHNNTVTYQGKAMAIVRSEYEKGNGTLKVTSPDLGEVAVAYVCE